MKKFNLSYCIFTFALSFLAAASYAAECTKNFGIIRYEKTTMSCLNITGLVTLEGSTITGTTQVDGTLTTYHAHLKDIIGKGKVELNDTIVDGSINLAGVLEADKSTFKNDLTITTNKMILKNSSTKNIVINADNKKQELLLIKTIVDGNIIFSGGQGTLYLYEASQVTGKVKGATIQMK